MGQGLRVDENQEFVWIWQRYKKKIEKHYHQDGEQQLSFLKKIKYQNIQTEQKAEYSWKAYRKGGTETMGWNPGSMTPGWDPRVRLWSGTLKWDPRVGYCCATLGWDPSMGPWGRNLGCDPGVGP